MPKLKLRKNVRVVLKNISLLTSDGVIMEMVKPFFMT